MNTKIIDKDRLRLRKLGSFLGFMCLSFGTIALFFSGYLSAFTFFTVAIFLLPTTRQIIQSKLKVNLTVNKTSFIVFIGLCIQLLLVISQVNKKQEKSEPEISYAAVNSEKEHVDPVINRIQNLKKQKRIKEALLLTDSIYSTIQYATNKTAIINEMVDIRILKASSYIEHNQYNAAIAILDSAKVYDESNFEIAYYKAICYHSMNKTQDAVNLLHPYLEYQEKAKELYNKINPPIKKIVGYETLCNDGSVSDARGSGACAHHGGVKNWNSPVYIEERKY